MIAGRLWSHPGDDGLRTLFRAGSGAHQSGAPSRSGAQESFRCPTFSATLRQAPRAGGSKTSPRCGPERRTGPPTHDSIMNGTATALLTHFGIETAPPRHRRTRNFQSRDGSLLARVPSAARRLRNHHGARRRRHETGRRYPRRHAAARAHVARNCARTSSNWRW